MCFDQYFIADGYGSLIKSIAFCSSSLNHLKKNEILVSCIMGYYSLFHFGLAVVMLCPEKTKTHRQFLTKLKKIRMEGNDPLRDITHKKLIEILKDMGFDDLSKEVELGKKIREFYNYGPRTTWDKSGNIFFGNPISANKEDKIYIENAVKFCKHIDKVILKKFKNFLPKMSRTTLYALSGQFEVNNHYLEDDSLHLTKLFSSKTIKYAKKILSQLKGIMGPIIRTKTENENRCHG